MFKVKKHSTDKGRSIRLILLSLFSLELGLHDLNGMHLSAGLGVGPVELSMSFHTWDKW